MAWARDLILRRNVYAGRLLAKIAVDVGLWATCLTGAVWLRFEFSIPRRGGDLFAIVAVAALTHIAIGFALGLYRGWATYGSFDETAFLLLTIFATTLAIVILDVAVLDRQAVPVSTPIMGGLAMVALAGLVRHGYRLWREKQASPYASPKAVRVLVFGAGDGGNQAISAMLRDPAKRYVPVGLLDDNPDVRRRRIRNVPVSGDRHALGAVAASTRADTLLIAIPSATSELVTAVSQIVAEDAPQLRVTVLPSLPELLGDAVAISDFRDLSDVDIIGRHQVHIDTEAIAASIRGRVVMVTGAGGSIGSELCRQLHRFSPAALVMVDRDESALHAVQLSIEGRALLDSTNIVLADIRDADVVDQLFARHQPAIVFHAAALKHLAMLERHPAEAVKTNIWGTLNVLNAARSHGVRRFVNTSTDKAANPASVLGYTKRLTERLTVEIGASAAGEYLSVRFGNVLGSRGSVLGVFQAQIAAGGPVTVTDREVTRYFMTVSEAVQLLIQASTMGVTGDVMVLDMGSPVKIGDVAERLIARSRKNVEVIYTGLRPGEKLHEDLFSDGEGVTSTAHPLIQSTRVEALATSTICSIDTNQPAGKLVDRLRELALEQS